MASATVLISNVGLDLLDFTLESLTILLSITEKKKYKLVAHAIVRFSQLISFASFSVLIWTCRLSDAEHNLATTACLGLLGIYLPVWTGLLLSLLVSLRRQITEISSKVAVSGADGGGESSSRAGGRRYGGVG